MRSFRRNGSEVGVDLNRNFGFHYGEDPGLTSECSEEFRGPNAFSERESQAIRDLVSSADFALAFNFHTFGNIWVYPFAYFRSKHARFPSLDSKTQSFYDGLGPQIARVSQAEYKTVFQSLGYYSEGEVSDWMLAELGVVSFSPEIGTHDQAAQVFNIPKDLIFPAYQQAIAPLILILDKAVFTIADAFMGFDHNGHLKVRFDNNQPASLTSPTIRVRASGGVFGLLQSVHFGHSREQTRAVSFTLDPSASELTLSLPKLLKLRNYEFSFHFSSPLAHKHTFTLEWEFRDALDTPVWTQTLVHNASNPFFHLSVAIVFACLIVASTLFLVMLLGYFGQKRNAPLATPATPLPT